jgi:predicted metal-dependent peptidase
VIGRKSQRANRSNTVKRINKRFPYIHAGRKTNHTAHIAIAIDQSGSVDDEMLSTFFGELNNLSKIVTFTVVPFDTEVDDRLVYTWKKGEKRRADRVMYGGTDFNAPTQWTNKHPEIDGLIVLTDMQAPAPVPCKVRRLWATTPECKSHPYFQTNEIVIGIKMKS